MEWNIKKLFLGYHFGCLHLITCRSRKKIFDWFCLVFFHFLLWTSKCIMMPMQLEREKVYFYLINCILHYCSDLLCTELNWTILYYTNNILLYCTVLSCTLLSFILLYCTVLYCTVLYCTTLTIFCCTAQYSNITYVHLTGSHAKETLQSANQLSSLYRVYGKNDKAEKLLSDSLTISRATFGNMYVLNSNVLYYT